MRSSVDEGDPEVREAVGEREDSRPVDHPVWYCGLMALAAAYATGFLFMNRAAREIDPLWITAARFGVAAAALTPVAAWGASKPHVRAICSSQMTYALVAKLVLLSCIQYVAPAALNAEAQARISNGVASVLVNVSAALTPALAALVLRGRKGGLSSRSQWGGVAVCMAGVAIIVVERAGSSDSLTGYLLVLLSALLHAVSNVFVQASVVRHYAVANSKAAATDPGQREEQAIFLLLTTSWVQCCISLLLAAGAAVVHGTHSFSTLTHAPAEALLCTLALGLFSQAGVTVLYFYLVKRLGASRFSSVNAMVAVIGVVEGIVLNGEWRNQTLMYKVAEVGGCCTVLAGLKLLTSSGEQPEEGAPEVGTDMGIVAWACGLVPWENPGTQPGSRSIRKWLKVVRAVWLLVSGGSLTAALVIAIADACRSDTFWTNSKEAVFVVYGCTETLAAWISFILSWRCLRMPWVDKFVQSLPASDQWTRRRARSYLGVRWAAMTLSFMAWVGFVMFRASVVGGDQPMEAKSALQGSWYLWCTLLGMGNIFAMCLLIHFVSCLHVADIDAYRVTVERNFVPNSVRRHLEQHMALLERVRSTGARLSPWVITHTLLVLVITLLHVWSLWITKLHKHFHFEFEMINGSVFLLTWLLSCVIPLFSVARVSRALLLVRKAVNNYSHIRLGELGTYTLEDVNAMHLYNDYIRGADAAMPLGGVAVTYGKATLSAVLSGISVFVTLLFHLAPS